jgi:hypothetical protein
VDEPEHLRRPDREIAEYLIDEMHPTVVIAVTTRLVPNTTVPDMTRALAALNITMHTVLLDNAADPDTVVSVIPQLIDRVVREQHVGDLRIAVDLTAGTVAMTLGLLRTALLLRASAAYVMSDRDDNGVPIPYTQQGRIFDPATVLPLLP